MAVTVQDPVLAWRRVSNAMQSFKPNVQLLLKNYKSWLVQFGGNPDLKFMPIALLDDTEQVVADAACKLMAIVLYKATATATWSKLTDSATTSSDATPDINLKQNTAKDTLVLTFGLGMAFANGITMQGNTTVNGGTSSGANAAYGFAILAAA